jgi:hypothetical protein
MTASRKFVIGLCAAFLAYGGFLTYEFHSAKSVAAHVAASLAVGDSAAKIERVFKDEGIEPFFSTERSCYVARIQLHQKRTVLITVYVDAEKKVTRVEVKSYMWI